MKRLVKNLCLSSVPISIAIILKRFEKPIVNRIVNITDSVNRFVYKHPVDYLRNGVTFISYRVQILKRMNLDTSEEDSFSNFV